MNCAKQEDHAYLQDKENAVSLMNSKLRGLQNKMEEDTECATYKVFSEKEKLESIGKMTREIDRSGYAFKTNRKRFRLTKL